MRFYLKAPPRLEMIEVKTDLCKAHLSQVMLHGTRLHHRAKDLHIFYCAVFIGNKSITPLQLGHSMT